MFLPLASSQPASLRPASSGISPQDWAILADFWYPVALGRELTEMPRRATLLDVDLVLFRGANTAIGIAVDACPHRHIRLSGGKVMDGQIVCPFHGLRFDTSGQCRHVPALGGDHKLPASYRVRSFPARERYGLIWTCLGDAGHHDIPVFPDLDGMPAGDLGFVAPRLWEVSAARQVENFFDLGHLPIVHATTLGGDKSGAVKPGRVELAADSVVLEADYVETPTGSPPRPCKFTYRVTLPFAIDFTVRDPSNDVMHAYNIPSPVSAHRSMVFQIIKILPREAGPPSDARVQQAAIDVFTAINQQDIDVLAGLVLPDMPLDQHHEIHLPVDNICGAYRSKLRELGLGR